jgi:hypothetical protein
MKLQNDSKEITLSKSDFSDIHVGVDQKGPTSRI